MKKLGLPREQILPIPDPPISMRKELDRLESACRKFRRLMLTEKRLSQRAWAKRELAKAENNLQVFTRKVKAIQNKILNDEYNKAKWLQDAESLSHKVAGVRKPDNLSGTPIRKSENRRFRS